MRVLPHDLGQVKYKIVQLYSNFFSWMNATKMIVLTIFWQKNGLSPLEVNTQNTHGNDFQDKFH